MSTYLLIESKAPSAVATMRSPRHTLSRDAQILREVTPC